MTKNEIQQHIEDLIDYQLSESNLTREDVLEVTMLNCLEEFYDDRLALEDLLKCAKYLEYDIDVAAAEEEKATRIRRKEMRKARRVFKRAEKDVLKHADTIKVVDFLFKNVTKKGDFLYVNCPFCKDNHSVAISITNKTFSCINCNMEGTLFDLMHKAKRYSYKKCLVTVAGLSNYHNDYVITLKYELGKENK